MSTYFDDASLVMIPSGYKDDKLYSIKPTSGDGDFTFSRDGSGASPATRVNSAGLIEKGRTNLLLQSNTFDTTWTTSNSSVTSGQSGYDGSNDAWLLNKSDAFGLLQQTISYSSVSTFSVYLKAGTLNWAWIILRDSVGSNDASIYVDLSGSGALGTSSGDAFIDANIVSIGSGWFRCDVTNSGGYDMVRIAPADGDGDLTGTSGNIVIQDAQVNYGLIAQDYVETTTAAASAGILGDMPRLDYSGGASCPSLLLEPARTNVLTQSEYTDSYGKNQTPVITENAHTSPEGVQNAINLNIDSTSEGFFVFPTSVTSGDSWTISVFVKYIDGSQTIKFGHAGTGFGGDNNNVFNVSTGSVVTESGGSCSVEDYGNGWYRLIATRTAAASSTGGLILYGNNNTDSNFAVYGFQMESGSYATSYVPSYGSATARAEDDLSDSTFTALPNANFTIFFEVEEWAGSEGNNYQIRFLDASGNRNVQFRNRPEGWRWLITNDAGGAAYLNAGNYTYTKMACRYNGTNYQLFADGSAVGSPFSASDTAVLDSFESFGIGIKQMLCFPTALTDAECISLTTL